MRILMVTPTIGAAGAEIQLVHLADGLARAGHRVVVVCIRAPWRDTRALTEAGVEVLALNCDRPWSRVLTVWPLARLARRADVVYCSIWDASLWGRLAAVLARRPVVVTEHSPGRRFELAASGRGRGRWIALHNRLLARATYAMVTVGRWQRDMLAAEGVPLSRVLHVPNGVPIDELRAAADDGVTRAVLGLPPEAKVLLHPARFHPMKNQGLTLEATRRLRDELGDVRVLFAGDGDGRAAVEARARELGAGWATFLGARDDVPALMRLADAVVLPSLGEGMPVTLVEALVLGTPVVATDVGGVADVLAAVGAPPPVSPGDLDAFVAACRELLAPEGPARRIPDPERVARLLDAELMTSRYAAIFAGAVARIAPARLALPGPADG